MTSKPDYGVDAPNVVRNLALAGCACVALSVWGTHLRLGPVLILFPRLASALMATVFFLESGLMIEYARRGKFRQRERMFRAVDWSRVHDALDIGTGRGLLLAGVAHRIPAGRTVGVDIFQAWDLSGNRIENTRRNLELEGVAANTEVRDMDARRLDFPDASFDLVVSNLCLHNIHGRAQRALALAEIARVLRPRGQAVIADFLHTGEYEREFLRLGRKARRTPFRLSEFPPLRSVILG